MIQRRYHFLCFNGWKIIKVLLRYRLYTLVTLLGSFLIITSFYLRNFHSPLKVVNAECNKPESQTWEIISVPGQIRSIKTKITKELHFKQDIKTILLWTTYFSEEFSNDFYFFKRGQETFKRYKCKFSNCFITSDRSLLATSDAVLYHARDLNFTDIPKRPRDDQLWILYSMEPPKYMRLKWHLIRSLFNWTMTYRSDSDVQVKYGDIISMDDSLTASFDVHKTVSNKPKGAIWMVSNCRTESRRELYVKELKKFFHVDVYGECSRKGKCEPKQSEACYELLSNYKYYLSFENSICKDYITEKFFNILKYDVVPVVLGGGNYTAVAPKNSFIDATKYSDPRNLAEHLIEIASNASWYDSFFEWKLHYSVHLYPWMCDLCERLHQPISKPQTLPRRLWYWWVPGAMCRRWTKMKDFKNIFEV